MLFWQAKLAALDNGDYKLAELEHQPLVHLSVKVQSLSTELEPLMATLKGFKELPPVCLYDVLPVHM